LPLAPYRTVLKLERRLSPESMVRVSGNLYSVPDTARRRVLDVHVFTDQIQIFEDGVVVAAHAPLEGRNQKHLDPAHRKLAVNTATVRKQGDLVAIAESCARHGRTRHSGEGRA
jgi:hypothetical protein